jgi:hypothetical protein
MRIRHRKRRLWDAYRFPGFTPSATVRGIFGDPQTRVITLTRRSKKRDAGRVACCITRGTIAIPTEREISRVGRTGSTWNSIGGASPAGVAGP